MKMLGNLLLVVFIALVLFSSQAVRADVGIGLQWNTEELSLQEFEEKCIRYSIYNPFDTGVTASMNVEKGLERFLTKIEPKQFYLPAYTGASDDNAAKLANNQYVQVCFKADPFRWPPFQPLHIDGAVLAIAHPGDTGGAPIGSAAASVVQGPLTLRIGSESMFYRFCGVVAVIVIAIIVVTLKLLKKLPKRKKKYCKTCKKKFSYKNDFCPKCGSRLEVLKE